MPHIIQFPDPNLADDEGLLAVGGNLSEQFLLEAYSQGIFPWFSEGDPIMWWSPNPRMILFPGDFKLSKSLMQKIKSKKFEVKKDTCFELVIVNCSEKERKGQEGTWITPDMIDAYIKMHKAGYAHSIEVFHNNTLAGGLYGISLGKAFFGESMFYNITDASKIALYELVQLAIRQGFHFIDAQQSTAHMKSMGAKDVQRKEFLQMLKKALLSETIRGSWSNL